MTDTIEDAAAQAAQPVKQAAIVVKTAAQRFADLQSSGGIVLLGATILAIAVSNSPLAVYYDLLLDVHITVQVADIGVDRSILHWVNDGLMAIFFLYVGLELKREFRDGQFADFSQIAVPLAGALGGMAVPVLLYVGLNLGDVDRLQGWAIPMATDIAFALGVLALLGKRIPLALRVFLLSLAIFDDLGAIMVIALFHSGDLAGLPMLLIGVAVAVLLIMNLAGVTRLTGYILGGIALWFFVLKSGVHATLAGVLLAMVIPTRSDGAQSPAEVLETALDPWVVFGVMPVFAFANAGLSFAGITAMTFVDPVVLGIVAGLFLGKQIGVLGGVLTVRKLTKVDLPEETTWTMLYGAALLSGIGFTMSLFIGGLAFGESGDHAAAMRLGVLSGSALSALLGLAVLLVSVRGRAGPD